MRLAIIPARGGSKRIPRKNMRPFRGRPMIAWSIAAAQAAGLADALSTTKNITVFAPTDEAFAKLPAGTVDDLLKPENKDKLVAILTYHVVPGKVMAADVAGKDQKVKTVQGGEIDVNGKDGVTVNGAKVIKADIVTDNGVIHVIDAVILPKM